MSASPEDRSMPTVGIYDGNGAVREAGPVPSAAEVPPHVLPGGTARLDRQLPPGGGKIERIAQHSKGLFQDLSSWVELKLKLTRIEMEERVEAKANELLAKAIVAGLAAVGGLFLLITLSLGLAALLIWAGLSQPLSYFLGFLIVTLILFIVAAVVRRRRPSLLHMASHEAKVEEKKLTPTVPAPR